jgi:hypothetical protein
MSVELVHPNGEEFHLSDAGWKVVLRLARQHGWEPAGRAEDMRSFSREEADSFAEAVERGLAEASVLPKPTKDEIEEMSEAEALPYVFSGRSEQHWRTFAAFCRRGGFSVRESERGG